MRFVPINCIRAGMILDRTLYGSKGQILLHEGNSIKEAYIEKLKLSGYNGIYIRDELSKDIEIKQVISENLRMKIVKEIENVFIETKGGKSISEKSIENIGSLVNNMIEEVLENKHLMVNLVDLKVFDNYVFYHSVNVTVLAVVMGVALDLSKEDLYDLGLGALLHDIGKVFIEKEILDKPGKLTDIEFERIQNHSMLGYDHLKKNLNLSSKVYAAVCQHHEKYNGLGYPLQKKGKDIFIFGRVIAIADVYDALTSDRSYRKAMLPSEAIEYIMGNSGNMFDPELVGIFVRKVAPYPIGTCVKLSNGIIGIVVENYEDNCMRPKIKIIDCEKKITTKEYINLRNDPNAYNMTIVEIVDV